MDRLQDERRRLNRQHDEIRRLYRSEIYAERHPLRIEMPKERRTDHVTVVPVPVPVPYSRKQDNPLPKLTDDTTFIHDSVQLKEVDTTGNYAFLSWLLSDTFHVSPLPYVNKPALQPVQGTKPSKSISAVQLNDIPPIKIFFDINSAIVDKRYDDDLNFIAVNLTRHKNYKIKLSGYTDNSGSPTFNLQLSKKRADAVRQYLLNKHVSPDQIITVFYGEKHPHGSNHTAEGKVLNRRVDIKFLERGV